MPVIKRCVEQNPEVTVLMTTTTTTLSGFDQKQEFVLRRLDKLDDLMALLLDISSLGAAAGALPLDAEQQDGAALREKLRTHFKHSKALGDNLRKMIKDGKL